jgi:hypothetical protein
VYEKIYRRMVEIIFALLFSSCSRVQENQQKDGEKLIGQPTLKTHKKTQARKKSLNFIANFILNRPSFNFN